MVFNAVVKSVLSGDTVILRGKPRPNGPPLERLLALSNVQAPRFGNKEKNEEDFAFQSREFLRKLLVGKPVSFSPEYETPHREYGSILIDGNDVATLGVKNGWLKVRERKPHGSDEASVDILESLQILEEEARNETRGMWNPSEEGKRNASFTFDSDSRTFVNQYKGKELDAIIEQVRDASTLRVLLLLPDKSQQYINLFLSGIKAPACKRDDSPTSSEPFGEEAKSFVETRLLQQDVKVILEGTSQTGDHNFFGSIHHPKGNITEFLLSNGFAKCVDWSISMTTGGPAPLRKAESDAKSKKLRIWKDYVKKEEVSSTYEAQVIKVVTGDTVLIKTKSGEEKKLQLASVKQAPKGTPSTASGGGSKSRGNAETGYQFAAREFLRKKLIGNEAKTVKVVFDYHKPANDGFEAKDCATIFIKKKDIGEMLVERGFASVIRHRKDDDSRSHRYDDLLQAEEKAKESQKGIHSSDQPPITRIVDASETAAKARQFLGALKRDKHAAIVDHVTNGSRLILWIPQQNCRAVFVLEGIRAPRAARSPSDASEPFGKEALDFSTQLCLQHDVEIEISDVDKTGAFIGALYVNGVNLAASLVKHGLATVHESSASRSKYASELFSAESTAKEKKEGLWKNFDAEVEAGAIAENDADVVVTSRKEYIDIVVSEVLSGSQFYVQQITDDTSKLEELMKDLSFHHDRVAGEPVRPRVGDVVSAKFTEDDSWYRAKVRKVSSAGVDVLYVDYGNSEVLPTSRIRALPEKFKQLKGQAQEAVLSFVASPAKEEGYGDEAMKIFWDLAGNKKLVAKIDAREGSKLHLTLYDPSYSTNPDKSLNREMVHNGYALVTPKVRFAHDPKTVEMLLETQEQAKKDRVGMFVYGDITPTEV